MEKNKIKHFKGEKKEIYLTDRDGRDICVRDVDQNVSKYLYSQELSQNILIKTTHAEFQVM